MDGWTRHSGNADCGDGDGSNDDNGDCFMDCIVLYMV